METIMDDDWYEVYPSKNLGVRKECSGCHMFGFDYDMTRDHDGNDYHYDCHARIETAKAVAQESAQVLYLVPKENVPAFVYVGEQAVS